MIVLIVMIISIIIYLLSGRKSIQQTELSDITDIVPKFEIPAQQPLLQQFEQPVAQQPAQQLEQPTQPITKKRKTVRFTPVIDVRAFNVNDGEIVEQYARQI